MPVPSAPESVVLNLTYNWKLKECLKHQMSVWFGQPATVCNEKNPSQLSRSIRGRHWTCYACIFIFETVHSSFTWWTTSFSKHTWHMTCLLLKACLQVHHIKQVIFLLPVGGTTFHHVDTFRLGVMQNTSFISPVPFQFRLSCLISSYQWTCISEALYNTFFFTTSGRGEVCL